MSRRADLGMDSLRHGGQLCAHRAGDTTQAQPFARVAHDGLTEPAEKTCPAQGGPVWPTFDRHRAQCVGLGSCLMSTGRLDGIVVNVAIFSTLMPGVASQAGTCGGRAAAIYQVYIRGFADGNGDGTEHDLAGVRAHARSAEGSLGIDALSGSPLGIVSPLADDGYDV